MERKGNLDWHRPGMQLCGKNRDDSKGNWTVRAQKEECGISGMERVGNSDWEQIRETALRKKLG